MTMDKRSFTDCVWICMLQFCCLLVLARACQVDNGEFITIIRVKEEAQIGAVIGSLAFDNPDQIASVSVKYTNPYFDYYPGNNSFVVKSRIDLDDGLNPVQLMTVECTPMNGPTLEVEIEFELVDINDFTPEFRPSSEYREMISEAAIPGTQVAIVEAKDDDIKNAYIIYELQSSLHSNYFELNSISGGKAQLALNHSLDYETERLYNLTIIAKDCQNRRNCSSNQRTATAEITVVVTDADDLSPEFESSTYRVSIFEDSIQDTVVVQLVARDQDDLNEPVNYSIEGAGSEYFSVNAYTGMVTVSDTSGIIRGTQYLLQAKAWQVNDVTKRTSTSLVIKIVATNGNAPQFTESSYDVTLSEGSPIDTSALTFTVTDRDTTAQMQFSLAEYPEDFPFQLRITGLKSADLVVAEPLDYETIREYSFVIEVSDGEFMSSADVHIGILNDNDHNPEFDSDGPYEFEVEWGVGAFVGRVRAVDRDAREDDSSPVTYRILPPHDKLFEVDNKGRITLKAELKEYTESSYLINVQAVDKGASPRATTTAVRIVINNIPTTAKNTSVGSESPSKERLVIYIVAGIAAFLLILVALLILCFIKRKAKKTAKRLSRKDAEQPNYDDPYNLKNPSSTMHSITDSQAPIIPSDDQKSEMSIAGVTSAESSTDHSETERNLQGFNYAEVPATDVKLSSHKYIQPNNLSVVSDSDECMEVTQHSDNNNSNIPPYHQPIKGTSDSGRSSMREDRSPLMKRIPFKSFLHQKSSSIDETGHQSQDEEIAMATFISRRNRGLMPTLSNSFNTGNFRSNVSNIRATEGPPIHTVTMTEHSHSSGFLAEAPEGFRSTDSYRTSSPHSRTSDYESNTPTPEITSESMIDYCKDLPTQIRDTKTRLPMRSGYSSRKASPNIQSGSLYVDQPGIMSSMEYQRSETPYSDVSTETDSLDNVELNNKPHMTIYF